MRFQLVLVTAAAIAPALCAQDQPPATPPPASQPQAAPRQAQDPDVAAGNEAFQNEDWPGAVKSYQAALAKGNNARIVHFRLGYALHMQKQYEEALKHHLTASQITNRAIRIDALYNAACAQALLGHKDEALKFLQYAIDAGFSDTGQIEKDTDMDPLREDERFKKLVAGIGKVPRLDQQLDFFLGSWSGKNDTGETAQDVTLSRPLPGSQAIVTTRTNGGGGSWTGLLVPNAGERTWMWTSADGMGTMQTLTGMAMESGGVRFEGRESSLGGQGTKVRITLTPRDGGVMEKVEVSDDGAGWRVHHEEKYTKK